MNYQDILSSVQTRTIACSSYLCTWKRRCAMFGSNMLSWSADNHCSGECVKLLYPVYVNPTATTIKPTLLFTVTLILVNLTEFVALLQIWPQIKNFHIVCIFFFLSVGHRTIAQRSGLCVSKQQDLCHL